MSSDPPPLPRPVENAGGPLDQIRTHLERWRDVTDGRSLVAGFVAFLVVLAAGFVVLRGTLAEPAPPIETVLPTVGPVDVGAEGATSTSGPSTAATSGATTPAVENATVVVHVAGAVAHPGIVELDAGARVADAVADAGGALADADLDRVNLAAPALDGSQIVVPRVGEVVPVPPAPASAATPPASGGPIDINTADIAALETLPGVGPATAAAIIAHREEHGPFTSVTGLDDVPGIGEARLETLRDLVTVG